MKRLIQSIFMIMLVLMVMQPVLAQDFMLKQKTHTDEIKMMGQTQPAKDMIQTIWYSEDAVVITNDESTVITASWDQTIKFWNLPT